MTLAPLIRGSATYLLGNFLYRGAAILLIPLYAHYLSPAEFGMLEIFYVTAALFQTLLASGVAHAALRYYFEFDDMADRNSAIVSAMLGSLVLSVVGVAALLPFSSLFSGWLYGSADHALAFQLVFCTIVFEISKEISLAYLRASERAGLYVVVSVCQLVGQLTANIYTVVVLKLGVTGVLIGNLAVGILVWAILTGLTIRCCGLRARWGLMRKIFSYGSPVMLSSLVMAGTRSVDRYLLTAFTSLSSIGHYALGLRIGTAIEAFVNDPFFKSYGPYRFSIMKQEGAGQLYARVLSYYALASLFITLGLSVFSKELIRLVSAPDFLDAYRVVPLILLPFPLRGVVYCLQTAIYVHKQSKYIFYASLASGAVHLAANVLLIPRFGIHGAASAQVLATLVSVAVTYHFAQRLQRLPYELGRVTKLLVACVSLGLVGYFVELPGTGWTMLLKAGVVLAFPLLLLVLRFPTADEMAGLRALPGLIFSRISRPGL